MATEPGVMWMRSGSRFQLPLVLLYTAGVYYVFRGRTDLEPEGY